VADVLQANRSSNGRRRELMEESLARTVYSETKRRPMIYTILNEV